MVASHVNLGSLIATGNWNYNITARSSISAESKDI